ncbi:AMP-binding protein [Variovorax sp. PCZ-1]|uniref:AMP-binding protein n=1 Tax=Variovorax sp. PCZ-1 TaxID=2835533 RepID=UPI001BCB0DCA|nr:AMP-binding protein [Variovorax sp. PCZ-1]MBS7809084.1 AMP-binding protein [Variovorax sp. PCZ-1]
MKSVQTDSFVRDQLPPPEAWPQYRFDRPELQFPDQLNAVEHLLDHAVSKKGFASNVMLRSVQRNFTYTEAQGVVNRIAAYLIEDCKLIPGNRVLLRGPNSIGMALCWLAVVKAGLVAVATMPLLRAKELSEIITKARPSLALCDGQWLAELEAAQQQSSSPMQRVICFNSEGAQDLGQLYASKSGEFTACPTLATDVAMMAFTSGTTGLPKAAVHLHRDLLAACECWPRHVLQAKPTDIIIGSPPLAFTFGLGGLLLFPMWAGASVYFHDKAYTPEIMVDVINNIKATISYTAPTFYRQMAAFAKAKGVKSLRISVSAGEGLPDATRQLWKEASGLEMLDGIGATEMFHIFISSAGADIKRGAIGKVVPGYTAKVVDDEGNELPRGKVGKLAVIGPTGCKYFADERQKNYVKNGWNYPGDAFMQDVDGYFFFQARADDMIISAGYNIGGPEVEDCLLKHPAVAECGVIGAPDEERGMVVKAVLILKNGFAGDEAMVKTLQEHVKTNLAPYKYPRQIEFRTSLPRTETGKLQRFKLRSLAS